MKNSHHKRESAFLAIDQGGHASRAMLYSETGSLIASSYREIATFERAGDVVEHDAHEFIQSVKGAIEDLCLNSEVDLSTIRYAGLACQRSSIVCWSRKSGEPLSPIISWQDKRTQNHLERYGAYREVISQKTGLLLNPHYGASKMRWCLENLSELEKQSDNLVISPVASFLLFHLLREKPVVIDPANAGRTLLYDYLQGDWSEELLEIFGIDRQFLPQCVSTRYQYGHLDIGDAAISFRVCTGDQSAAVFYSGVPQRDSLYVNVGTGAFVQQIVEQLNNDEENSLLKSIVFSDGEKSLYVREGTVNGAGRALQWYADKVDCDDYVDRLEDWINRYTSPPLFINSVSGIGSPYWISLASRFDRECVVEEGFVAIVESIVFLLIENIRLFKDFRQIFISGGMSNSDIFCQYLADLSNTIVLRQHVSEATSKGLFVLLSGQQVKPEVEKQFSPMANHHLRARLTKWESLLLSEMSNLT